MSETNNFKIEVDVTDNTKQVLGALKNAVERGLEAIGLTAEGYAKETITEAGRIDTGIMRNSIAHRLKDNENAVYIGTNVEYAVWHEVGTGIHAADGQGRKTPWAFQDKNGDWQYTRGVKPLHFLRNAAANHTEEYKNIMQASLEGRDV